MAEKLLTRNELAKHFKVHPKSISNWKSQGLIIPTIVINQRARYSLREVSRSLAEKQK